MDRASIIITRNPGQGRGQQEGPKVETDSAEAG